MVEIVTLATSRDEYDIRDAARYSMTVKELIDELERMDYHAKVVFSNDNGYTYGYVCRESIDSECVKTREEEEREEKMDELHEELTDLEARYENPGDYIDEDEHPMTDEEYRSERQALFNEYGITEEEYTKFQF